MELYHLKPQVKNLFKRGWERLKGSVIIPLPTWPTYAWCRMSSSPNIQGTWFWQVQRDDLPQESFEDVLLENGGILKGWEATHAFLPR